MKESREARESIHTAFPVPVVVVEDERGSSGVTFVGQLLLHTFPPHPPPATPR